MATIKEENNKEVTAAVPPPPLSALPGGFLKQLVRETEKETKHKEPEVKEEKAVTKQAERQPCATVPPSRSDSPILEAEMSLRAEQLIGNSGRDEARPSPTAEMCGMKLELCGVSRRTASPSSQQSHCVSHDAVADHMCLALLRIHLFISSRQQHHPPIHPSIHPSSTHPSLTSIHHIQPLSTLHCTNPIGSSYSLVAPDSWPLTLLFNMQALESYDENRAHPQRRSSRSSSRSSTSRSTSRSSSSD
ncbi:hypothetical protein INR49_005478 [Caranx melampygus]|nr:hypothetical protein INR49_005478 [Caranx melampygus]